MYGRLQIIDIKEVLEFWNLPKISALPYDHLNSQVCVPTQKLWIYTFDISLFFTFFLSKPELSYRTLLATEACFCFYLQQGFLSAKLRHNYSRVPAKVHTAL